MREHRCWHKHLKSLGCELEIVHHYLLFNQLGDPSNVKQGCFSLDLAFLHVHFVQNEMSTVRKLKLAILELICLMVLLWYQTHIL